MKLNNYDFIEIDQVDLNVVAEFILEAQRQGYTYNEAWTYFNSHRYERLGIYEGKIDFYSDCDDGYENNITWEFEKWVEAGGRVGDYANREIGERGAL